MPKIATTHAADLRKVGPSGCINKCHPKAALCLVPLLATPFTFRACHGTSLGVMPSCKAKVAPALWTFLPLVPSLATQDTCASHAKPSQVPII
mmetsp:Transcript_11345/g.35422  ORF Transcript_11345/g.35422 Transcript_11345/m.35422 type:complete len:93 (+) Transcript_11345:477-755(+)